MAVIGGAGLSTQQRVSDERAGYEKEKARKEVEIEPQAPEEEEARLDREVLEPAAAIAASSASGAADWETTAPLDAARPSGPPVVDSAELREWRDSVREIEAAVLDQVAALMPSDHQFSSRARVTHPFRRLTRLLDRLIRAPKAPDILLELRVFRSAVSGASRHLIDECAARTLC